MTGQPGSLQPLGPPRRSWSLWLTVGVPLAVLLLLGTVAVLVTHPVTHPVPKAGPDLRAPHKAARAYAHALVEEHFAEAQLMFCARDRAAISPASLAEHYFRPELTGFRVESVSVTHSEGTAVARAAVRFTTAQGEQSATDLLLVEENGSWRPCP